MLIRKTDWRSKPSRKTLDAYSDGFIDGYVYAGKGQVRLLVDIDYTNDTEFQSDLRDIIAHTVLNRYNLHDKVDFYLMA